MNWSRKIPLLFSCGLACILIASIGWRLVERAENGEATIEIRKPEEQYRMANTEPERTSDSNSFGKQENAWSQLDDLPFARNSDSDDQLLQTARDLIADSPEKAIAFAQSRSDPAFKLRLLLAVLRAWGETDPRSAMSWVLSQDESARASEMEATLKGAVTQTDIAVEIARELLGKNPDAGNVCASMLAGMLGAEGRFETAFGLVAEMSGDSKANSMAALFKRWGAEQPEDALKTLGMVSNEELRKSAYQAALNGWSENNYSSLAAYAMTLPSGAARDQALIAAVKNWSLQDPAGLGAWLNALPRGPEFDFGASMMILKTDNANRSPELAAGWVESISDPDLRRISLEHLVNQWVRIDPVAARQYFLNSTWISATQRNQILARIQNASIVEDSSIDATQP